MKINKVTIHNFRTIKEQTFFLSNYSLLIGANNSGKTNIIDALRVFYDEERFDKNNDFPKFTTGDNESWIEIEFEITNDEKNNLKEEYKQSDNFFKVRKYLLSSNSSLVKNGQSNIYAYENGNLSKNLFYGAKNISEQKLGNILYIPAISKIDEFTKLTGPSPLRDSLNFVMKKVVKSSKAFDNLKKSFNDFNKHFKEEASKEGISLEQFVKDINNEMINWNVTFGLDINEIRPEDIIKNLVSNYLKDNNLGEKLNITSFGQGLQRHLIYTLIKLAAKYKEITESIDNKKVFSPDFVLILFEEPEAFLHPSQQEILNINLTKIASESDHQVIISTHSPYFVSKNSDDMPNLIKLSKNTVETQIYQVSKNDLETIFQKNNEIKGILNITSNDSMELDEIRYALWLDPDRCCAFFADMVLICEGLSEKALIDCLIKEEKINIQNKKVYILNAGGKWDIHKYMNLFEKLGIKHSVLFDQDKDNERNIKINNFIENNKNKHTYKIYAFGEELEDFLQISKVLETYKKPLNVIWHYKKGKIEAKKIDSFIKVVNDLID